MPRHRNFDYIIVGAGSAGCTLAYRLTEDREVSVLLLEAGGWDRDPWIHIPLGWGRILQRRLHDWMYLTEPSPTMNNRRIETPRGKVIGGSSAVNAMAYYHGHWRDYDRWASMGLPQWSYAHVLPYFKRSEAWVGGESLYRGGSGPMTTQYATFQDPIIDAFIKAAGEAGHPFTEDYNGAKREGFARIQNSLARGHRGTTATAYLRRALGRPNLTVETDALTTGITMGGNRAQGVTFLQGGESHDATAEREVVLCGGSINTPHVMMLSGIGDPDHLAQFGIRTRVPLRGVGKNLYDHTSAAIQWERIGEPGAFQRNLRLDRIAMSLVQCYVFRSGFASDLPFGITAFLKTRPEEPIPDLQMMFWMGATREAKPYLPPFTQPFPDRFNVRVMPMRPTSTGHLSLASADPTDPIRIHQAFLETEDEWRPMRAGLRMARELVAQPALAPFRGRETIPGADKTSDADIDAHVRATMLTINHPIGTAKMGPPSDPLAVVDGQLKVYGTEGLRVVDASVMPDLIGGATNGPVIMIAEKAADMILGKPPLPPADLPH